MVSHIHSSSLPQAFVNSSSQHICNSIPENGINENTNSDSFTIRNSYSHDISSSTSVHHVHNSIAPQSHVVAGAQNNYGSNVSQVQAVAAASVSSSFVSHAGISSQDQAVAAATISSSSMSHADISSQGQAVAAATVSQLSRLMSHVSAQMCALLQRSIAKLHISLTFTLQMF